MLLSCQGRGPPPGRRSRRARAAGRRSCPRRARLAAARCRPTPRMACAPARMRSPWRVVLSLFPLLSVGGGREEELQLEERSSRRGKGEASEGECWASSRCRDRRREGSYEQERRMERASKKEEGKTEDRRNENGKKKRLPLPSLCGTLRVTTQSFFQLSSLPFLDLLLLAAGTQKPQEVSTRPALRSGGAARDGRGAKWRIPGGRGGASCRLKIGCSGFKRANCFSLASAAAQPPEGIAPPPPLACRLGSQHSTEAFAQAPLWPLRACRELRRLARRSARSDVRAAPGGAPSFFFPSRRSHQL